jgi:hypothetical protein
MSIIQTANGENSSAIPQISIDGVEPVLTLGEVAIILRWSYDSTRRYFKDLPGVLVKFTNRRYRRPYKQYKIPQSVLRREWRKMASHNDAKP